MAQRTRRAARLARSLNAEGEAVIAGLRRAEASPVPSEEAIAAVRAARAFLERLRGLIRDGHPDGGISAEGIEPFERNVRQLEARFRI